MLARDQVDVRRLPPYYVHRKVRETLDRRMKDMKLEKERKFRTTLSDHVLFAIICDSKKLAREKKKVIVADEEEK